MNTIKLRQYFWFVFSIMGVVFFWVGIWDGIGSLPFISTWWISLLTGLTLFAFSGIFLKENNLFKNVTNPAIKIVHAIYNHPEKHLFEIKYFDRVKKKDKTLAGHHIKHLEKGYAVFIDNGYEQFLPLHRITEIFHKGKLHWKP